MTAKSAILAARTGAGKPARDALSRASRIFYFVGSIRLAVCITKLRSLNKPNGLRLIFQGCYRSCKNSSLLYNTKGRRGRDPFKAEYCLPKEKGRRILAILRPFLATPHLCRHCLISLAPLAKDMLPLLFGKRAVFIAPSR